MNLDETQRKQVAAWIDEGLKIADIQKRMEAQWGLRLTYLEVRLLVDDLKLTPKEPARRRPENRRIPPPRKPPSHSPPRDPARRQGPHHGGPNHPRRRDGQRQGQIQRRQKRRLVSGPNGPAGIWLRRKKVTSRPPPTSRNSRVAPAKRIGRLCAEAMAGNGPKIPDVTSASRDATSRSTRSSSAGSLASESHAQAQTGAGVVPRHGGDQLLRDQPLRNFLGVLEFQRRAAGNTAALGAGT